MRALIQRVSRAAVAIEDGPFAGQRREIGSGLLILLGVREGDAPALCGKLAEKCAGLRIFDDEAGKLNLSAAELGHSALVVSQFTLYASTRKGRRPSWGRAAPGPVSEPLVEHFCRELELLGATVERGRFGADMQVASVNDGPVTIVIDTDDWQ